MILFEDDEVVCLRVNLELSWSVSRSEHLIRLNHLLLDTCQLFTKVGKLEDPK